MQGRPKRFEQVTASARIPKNPARWLRFLLLLCGDIEPHPGPAPERQPRGPLDLQAGFASSAAHKMRKSLDGFLKWLREEAGCDPDLVFKTSEHTALALRGYGLHLYSTGLPRYLYVYAFTAVQDLHPQHRNFLTAAWQVDKKWQRAEPGSCRLVLPVAAIRAAISLGLLWGWFRWTACLFWASWRCFILLSLSRLPGETWYSQRTPLATLAAPAWKDRRSRCDPLYLLCCLHLRPEDKLYPASLSSFRKQWNAVFERLGLPFRAADRGATPGVLRGSGTTFFDIATENIPLLAWRGRWARVRTLEHYLQEVAAQVMLSEVSATCRARIKSLDDVADDLLSFFSGAPQ
eukprot:s279_g1.t2